MKNSSCFSLAASLLLMAGSPASAQLFWDPDTADGVQNGSGTWNLTNSLWNTGSGNTTWDNSGSTIASFGSTASKTGGTITVEGTINVGGMRFNALSASTVADTPVTMAHTITGGTLQFANDAVIEAANNSSVGSGTVYFLNLNSVLKGNGLILQRPVETRINAFQYLRFGAANPELFGVLNINARAADNGIFLLLGAFSAISSMERVNVQSGSVLAAGGTGNTYSIPITIAGNGQGNGAIRVDSSSMRFTGGITLSADAGIMTNRSVINTSIDSAITDGGSGYGFQRFASSANSVLTLNGTSTYSGTTTLGRSGSVSGGITILNFAASGAPQSDMLYQGVTTAGGLSMIGGSQGNSTFIIQGKDGTDNSQRFGNVVVSGTRSNVILTPGVNGTVSLDVGTITRSGTGSIAFTMDAPGSITTSTAAGFLGPWATVVNKDGFGSWASVENGKLTAYAGSDLFLEGAMLSTMGTNANVNINEYSTGDVFGGFGTFQVNSISMNDATSDRLVDVGDGSILKLGSVGGIQITKDAKSLVVGYEGYAGAIQGATSNAQLWLSNLSTTGTLTVNSAIQGAVSVFINGTGKTILAGANTYSGSTQISSGELEIRHSMGLGDSVISGANTTVLVNGTLRLGGGITTDEPIILNGLGFKNTGALINTDGDNTIVRVLTVGHPTRINSESGTLIFRAANGTTDAIVSSASGSTTAFGGAGDITIRGKMNAAGNIITKDGAGTLTFAGTQTFTAAMTLSAGTVHLDFSDAYSPTTNILYNGVATPVALGLNSTALKLTGATGATNSQTFGALTLSNKTDITLASNGASSLTLTFGALTRNPWGILGMDLPSGSSLRLNTGSDNTLISTNGRAFAYIRDSVNGDEWAATGVLSGGTRPVVSLSSIGGYVNSTETTLSGNANLVTATTTLSADTTTSTLRFAQSQDTLITDGAAATTLTTSGILVSSTVGAKSTTISTDFLRPSPATVAVNPDLNIIQNNTQGALYITGGITNSLSNLGAAAVVSVVKTGPGLVVLSGANTFSGNLRVYEGALQFAGGSVNSGMEFIVGSGGNSGKIIVGSGSTGLTLAIDYITTQGVGTENRIVGGASAMSQILLTGSTTTPSTFSTGFIGGSGQYENNIEMRLSATVGSLSLGPNNTYAGATINSRGTIVVEKLANIGEVSSLGTGDFNGTAGIIVMANQTTSTVGSYATAVLKYIGSTDSVTNRPISVTNTDDIRDIVTVTAVLENAGTGTLKFTAPFTAGGGNVADRTVLLTGTNMGLNEIVSFANASTTILGKVEKEGVGTWALTGSSTYSGGTTVRQGTLLANNNPALPGSATGLGNVTVQAGGTLGGTGRVAPADGNSILITGGVLNPGLPTSLSMNAAVLTLDTTGAGLLSFTDNAFILMDLFAGAGAGNNLATPTAADLLKVSGQVSIGADTTLRVTNPNGLTAWALNDQWQLFDWSGLTTPVQGGFDHYDLPTLPEGLAWNVDSLLTTGVLSISTLVVVPEPSRLFFFGLGLTSLILRRRRQR